MRLSFADGLFWTSVACCAIAQLLIIRSVLVARPLPPREGSVVLPRRRGGVELFWTIVPAVALLALLLGTWRTMNRAPASQMRSEGRVETSR